MANHSYVSVCATKKFDTKLRPRVSEQKTRYI